MYKESEIADYLNDIVAAIAEIEEFTSGMNYDDFAADKKTVNAVIRSLEVLGEATKHVLRQECKICLAMSWML